MLAAILFQRQMKKWTGNCHTGIVDQSGQLGRAKLCAHFSCSPLYGLSVRYIHDQRSEGLSEFTLKPIGVTCGRTLPNSVKPFAIRTFVMPHPIPVETSYDSTLFARHIPCPSPIRSSVGRGTLLYFFMAYNLLSRVIFSLSPGRAPRLSTHSNTKLAAHHAERMSTLGLRAAFLIGSAIWLDRIVSPMFHPTEMICCDLEARVDHRTSVGSCASRMSAAFSAIAMTAAFVLPRTIDGITEASATRRPSVFKTRRSGSTTLPIAHVLVG